MKIHWLWILGLGLLLGCGRGSEIPRATVSGKVTFQGQPIADGTIQFIPAKGTKGPAASAAIKDGDYKVVVGGGVPVGTLRVEIQGFEPVAGSPNRPPAMANLQPKKQYVPAQYNRQSKMEVTVEDKGEQIQNFDLK